MPNVIFVEADGTKHEVEGNAGDTVMELAINNMVPGMLAECGGACACATCHVYVSPEWAEKVGPLEKRESEMVAEALDVKETSRLACQIHISDELDGLTVALPENQF